MARVVNAANLRDVNKLQRIQAAADFIAGKVATTYQKDLSNVTFFAIMGGNSKDAQPGLCYNWDKIGENKFRKRFESKRALGLGVNLEEQNGISVLLNTEKPDAGGTLWPPTIFHECGHAMFDPKTGGGESHSWLVELEIGLARAEAKDEIGAITTFVQSRKNSTQYLESAYGKYPTEWGRVHAIVERYAT